MGPTITLHWGAGGVQPSRPPCHWRLTPVPRRSVLHYSSPAPNGFRYCTLRDRWALSSQWWPNLPPWKMRSLGQPYVSFQWGDILSRFLPFSRPGVVSADRQAVRYGYDLINPLMPAIYYIDLLAVDPGSGNRVLHAEVRLAAAFPLLPYDYTAVYTSTAYPGVFPDTTSFLNISAWDSVNGISVLPCPAHWYPALLGEVGVF